MKRFLALSLALVLTLGILAGCGSQNAPEPTDASQGGAQTLQTVTQGKLTLATSPDFAPMVFVDATKSGQDKYVGFDILLAKFLADSLNLELVIQPMSFDACQTAVSMGAADLALAGFVWKADRAENYNLSDGYRPGGNEDNQILITTADKAGQFPTVESLKGRKVGVQTASLQESLVQSQLPECEKVVFSDLTTALMQLRNGDFDVLAVAKTNGDAMIANNPDLAESGFYFEVDEQYIGYVALMRKGNDALTDAVNLLLAEAKAAGYYEQWLVQAKSTAGIEVSFDDQGHQVTEPAASTQPTQ